MDYSKRHEKILSVLPHIFPLLSMHELKRFRFVSKDWSNLIYSHSKLRDIPVIIDKTWTIKTLDDVSSNFVEHWKSVAFKSFCLRNNFMKAFWPKASQNVTSVTLIRITLECEKLCKFLHSCEGMKELTLKKLKFPSEIGFRNGEEYSFLCQHESCEPAIPVQKFRPQNLRKISLQQLPVIPLCLLDYIRLTCNGHLEEFEYKDTKWDPETRRLKIPTLASMGEAFKTIYEENRTHLRKFTLDSVTGGHTVLQNILQANFMGRLPKLKLCQPKPIEGVDVGEEMYRYFAFMEKQLVNLVELELCFHKNLLLDYLQTLIPRMTNLTKFSLMILDRNCPVVGRLLDLRGLQNLHNLEKISIFDNARQPSVSNAFLHGFPGVLKELKLHLHDNNTEVPGILEGIHERILDPSSSMNLTTLVLYGMSGSLVDNDTMQMIITNLPKLYELVVHDSLILTDAGITGLPTKVVEGILRFSSFSILTDNLQLHPTVQVGRNIRELSHLHKLSLKGCKKLSDVSAHSLKFPYLRELNISACNGMSDLGLGWIGQGNPCLEILKCERNYRLSNIGINSLIVHSGFKIKSIRMTKTSSDKNLEGLQIQTCPEFKKVVTKTNTFGVD